MEENVSIGDENSPFKVTVDKYCNYIIEIKKLIDQPRVGIEDDDSNIVPAESPGKINSMTNINFLDFVNEISEATRTLSLNGKDVFLRYGKRLEDQDIQNLLIFLRENPAIVDLDLSFNDIHCDGFIDIINYLTAHEQIVRLNLQNNEIRTKGVAHLCESGDNLKLEVLWLNGNKFGVESSKQLALMLSKNRWLRELNVAEVDQTASSLVYFTTILRHDQDLHNATLKTLNISSPHPGCMYYFDSAHFATLIGSMLKTNKCLQNLHIQKFGFTCHDIELMFVDGKLNRTLLLLDLSGNNIGDFGVEFIAEWLAKKPAISRLVLAHNIITSAGARALSQGLPFSKIKHLDISYNRIDDFGISDILNTLKKSPCIRSLKLFGNCVGYESSKIINRMLLSGVLVQNHLDVRPYRVNHEWQCALYQEEHF
ncbi:leucine-rich repeat-containing protein 74A-like [Venturia canescens]|uniref:leucine-rich repeat-containing protein 74A-like n=1 Tax=Venturia canescens TaxID=32260 RepID=UPI001C9C2C8A|nr:leucine-rich repeat-containing protein 74A-like [Venturia canescens]